MSTAHIVFEREETPGGFLGPSTVLGVFEDLNLAQQFAAARTPKPGAWVEVESHEVARA